MSSKVNRRRFLKSAVVGTTATVAVSTQKSACSPLPVPDDETKASVDGIGPQTECCTPASKLIFACSGAADVGKISDLAARKLTEDGVGKMFCLAGVGGRVKGIMENTKAAQAILAIDGCSLQCARNTLEQAGFKKFEHLCLSDIGMEKGSTSAIPKNVDKAAAHGRKRLTA